VGAIAGAPKHPPRPRAEKVEDPDEELAERPRRKKLRRKKKRARNTPLILGLIGVLVLLIGGGATLAVVFWPFGKKAQAVAENNPSRSGPAPAGRSGSVESGQADGGSQQFAAGRTVFETNNCARCHTIGGAGGSSGGFGGPRGGPGMGRNRGPDLGTGGKDPSHTVEWLMEQIRNPKSHKADARMPAFEAIKDDDLRALAEYLASLK
jgi:mono/diheme cytochrome c family protein